MHARLLVVFFTWLALAWPASAAEWRDEYARLLKKYVTPTGVRYAAWKASAGDVAALGRVVDAIAAAPVQKRDKEGLAFYLNAYNAWILHETLEEYPTKSVAGTLFTFFTAPRITVAGEKMSFNRLEKKVIRERYNEPRIHFALNCASRSCPPLRNEPFDAARLDTQLDRQARDFLNTSKGVNVTRDGVKVSKLYDWYEEDLAKSGGPVPSINKYRETPLPPDAKVSYQNYDWGLNEAR